ncbi:MAG: stage III sporulation protein AG [Clostridiales bacterium]|nr:stage III sporulation protein AG [Clostridiales bacterium]
MKQEDLKQKIMEKIKEIGITKILLLLLAGVILVMTSLLETEPKTSENKEQVAVTDQSDLTVIKTQQKKYKEQLEKQLSDALLQVEGVGKTKVMITLKGTEEIVVNKDTPYEEETTKEKDSTGGEREQTSVSQKEETVLVTDREGNSVPYVIKQLEPEIAGVVVVAEGGGSEQVIQEITDACEVLFSLPVHKIKVMKMKTT